MVIFTLKGEKSYNRIQKHLTPSHFYRIQQNQAMKINHLTPNLHLSVTSKTLDFHRTNSQCIWPSQRALHQCPHPFFHCSHTLLLCPNQIGTFCFSTLDYQLLSPRMAMASIYPPFQLKYYLFGEVSSHPVCHVSLP